VSGEGERGGRRRGASIAVLGPGGVGGLLAGALSRAGEEVAVIAREPTAAVIAERGLRVESVIFGEFVARVPALTHLREPVDALIVATKSTGLTSALERVEVQPGVVLPQLNGLDHLAQLRERFVPESVLAGSIRVEADRPEPGVIVHSSPFLRVDMAGTGARAQRGLAALSDAFANAGVPARVLDSEAQVMWSKLVRLNALACTTTAYDKLLGEILATPAMRADLVGAIEEACEAGRAEGAADVDAEVAIGELERAHPTLGSSMQRDVAAGRATELDAIPGAVLRAAARHGIPCPTIERLVSMIAARAGIPAPAVTR
jgi:2-dehydropantoate 2-reductase